MFRGSTYTDCISFESLIKELRENKPSQITNLPLTGYYFTFSMCKEIGEALKTNKYVEKLVLEGNNYDPAGIIQIFNGLAKNTSLKHLMISDIHIYLDGYKCLGEALAENQTLKELKLENNDGLKGEKLKYIIDGLFKNKTLRIFSFINNHLSSQDIQELVELLKNPDTKIKELNLNWNGIDPESFQYLANALKTNKSLEILNLDYNYIGNDRLEDLKEALMVNRKLNRLSLRNNQIMDIGLKFLVEGLKSSRSITHLNLNDNHIQNTGAQYIGDFLKTDRALKILYLALNRIEDDGIENLEKGLLENETLTKLVLSSNRYGKKGHLAIARIIEKSKTLLEFCIAHNKFSYVLKNYVDSDYKYIIKSIIKSLEKNTTMTLLYMSYDQIKPGDRNIIDNILERNNSISERREKFKHWDYCNKISNLWLPVEIKLMIFNNLLYSIN